MQTQGTFDIRELDRRAVHASTAVVATATTADLSRPSPCTGWALRDLIDHMSAQHHGFAAAARGDGGALAAWEVHPSNESDDPIADYLASSEHVLAALAAEGVLDREFLLAEFSSEVGFPAATAIGFHFIDYLVHTWDVAESLGRPWTPDEDLLEPALAIALDVPNGTERLESGAAFAPTIEGSAHRTTFEQILALLGRSTSWA